MSADKDTKEYFRKAERQLFKVRMLCMSDKEMSRMLQKTFTKLQSIQNQQKSVFTNIYNVIQTICQSESILSPQKAVQKYIEKSQDCFRVAFQIVPNLVAARVVELDRGIALIPYSKLVDVLINIFDLILQEGIDLAQTAVLTQIQSDSRMAKLTTQIQVF